MSIACSRKPFCLQPQDLLLISEWPFAYKQKLQERLFCTAMVAVPYRNASCFVPQKRLSCSLI